MAFAVKAIGMAAGGRIPREFTCEGADTSPSLRWTGAPPQTRSFALILDDPDAPGGTWTHWLMWNIPGKATGLPSNVTKAAEFTDGARQGSNDFKRIGYSGPCPPPGRAHRYFFHLYALDCKLDLRPGAGRAELEHAIKGHVIQQAEWMGRYQR
ncbi:MAG: YbhB/YbcL family Raf kinase inhibitor-like protein [Acidobacteriaceae bacterium]